MALTQVKTLGIADDAVTGAKIADDTVAEANMANDAIGLAEIKAGTDGQILTFDASGNPSYVGPGTDGQVLTSTGAGSPPAFEDAAGGGVDGITSSANATSITIDSSERVMIGTSTPGYSAGDDLTIQPPSGSGGITIRTGTSDSCKIYFADGTSGDAQYRGTITYDHSSDELSLASPNGNALTIETNKDVTIEDGDLIIATSGHGINFSANTDDESGAGSVSAELLNDYERGTWTPSITSNGGASYGYQDQEGYYVKVGDLVWISAYIRLSSSSSTGSNAVNIAGAPFASDNARNALSTGYIFGMTDAASPKICNINSTSIAPMKEHAYDNCLDNELWNNGNERWTFAGCYTTA